VTLNPAPPERASPGRTADGRFAAGLIYSVRMWITGGAEYLVARLDIEMFGFDPRDII